METEIQSQQIDSSNNKLFVIVAASVLLTAIIIGSAAYFWQKSANEKAINSLEQKISSLEEQISVMKNLGIVPKPTSPPVLSPSPTSDSTANWKTYELIKDKVSIRLPSQTAELKCDMAACWMVSTKLSTGATLSSISSPSTLTDTGWNEVLDELHDKKVSYEERNVQGNSMLHVKTTNDILPFNTPLAGTYREGIILKLSNESWVSLFIYRFPDQNLTEEDTSLFTQILSTFKFTD